MNENRKYILLQTDNKGNVKINKRAGQTFLKYYTSNGGDRLVSGNFISIADRFERIGDAMRKAIELHKTYNKWFKAVPVEN